MTLLGWLTNWNAPSSRRLRRLRSGGGDATAIAALESRQLMSAAPVADLTSAARNIPPTAVSATATINEDTVLSDKLKAVDPNTLPGQLSYSIVSQPLFGKVVLNGRNYTYTPSANFAGLDFFTFKASDGQSSSAAASVSITVLPINDIPEAYSLALETPMNSTLDGRVWAFDADGTPLTYELVTGVTNGVLYLLPDGRFSYAPTKNFSGPDQFQFRVTDGVFTSNIATIDLNVLPNQPPEAFAQEIMTPANTLLNARVWGADPEGSNVTYELVGSVSHGTLTFRNNGTFSYRPASGFTGLDQFTFRVSDGAIWSQPAVITLNVEPNDPPLAFDLSEIVLKNIPIQGRVWGEDPEGVAVTYELVSTTAHGLLTFSATGEFTYKPTTDFLGMDTFTFRVFDGDLRSNVATVSLKVTSNLPPEAYDLSLTTAKNKGLHGRVWGWDPDAAPLLYELVSTTVNGVLNFKPDGTFNYQPNTNFVGYDSFTFRVYDGELYSNTATISLTVTATREAAPPANNARTTRRDLFDV